MTALALVGSAAFFLDERTLERITLPLVAFSAGSLLGGAFFHMLPASVVTLGATTSVFGAVVVGFAVFFALEQFLHWHHCHRSSAACKQPLTYLILIGDGLHNFIGGLAVAGAFLIDIKLGIAAWLAAAAHEVPQELGDFAVLVHGGWEKRKALLFNVLSASTFLIGGLVAYVASLSFDVGLLLPFAAGNFIYIAASDLVPEVNKNHGGPNNVIHFSAFVLGTVVLLLVRVAFH